MKARCFVVALFLFFLSSAVSAQTYLIRVTNNTNLRASYSLDSAVLTSARAGATVEVTGQHNRWLRVQHEGRELWMASWVSHSRVQTSPAPQADVDNCCDVNRQCATNKEWVDGYWAYQRNECPVGGTSAAGSTAQPVSAAPANLDNCCFVDRQCQTDQQWADGYWAYQNNQCAAPTQSLTATQPLSSAPDSVDNCCFVGWQCQTDQQWHDGYWAYQNDSCEHPGIVIEGSPRFTSMMKRVLEMLKAGAPQWHNYVLNSGLQRIRMTPPGYTGFSTHGMTYSQGYDDSFVQDEFYHIAIAGILTHESCHAYQWITGTATIGWRNEIHCVEAQLAVHEALDPICRECNWYRDIIANIAHDPTIWWWD